MVFDNIGSCKQCNQRNQGPCKNPTRFLRAGQAGHCGTNGLLDNISVMASLDGRYFVTNGSGIVVKCCWTKKSRQNREFLIVYGFLELS